MKSLTTETTYKFFVDGHPFHAHGQLITGEEIRQLAGVDKHLRLFIGEQGAGHPDRQVLRDQRVDLGTPGEEKFYTLEPPSMDIS
jgi:hypothetical protein